MTTLNEQHKNKLVAGIKAMNIDMAEEKIARLLCYIDEFHKWNKAYNLSAIRDPGEMISRHLLDSLALVPFVENYRRQNHQLNILDVGTGGGLPGVPLAITFPDIPVTLLDSNGKKTRFLFQTALKLGLTNIQVENNRAEHFSPADKFAIVTSRAFASLADMAAVTRHLLAESGQYWAMKGQYPEAELKECEEQLQLLESHTLSIPESEGERHLLVLGLR